MRPGEAQSLLVYLCLRLGHHHPETPEMLVQGVSLCPGPSSHPVALLSLGARPASNPLPGIFSLPGVLCLILGSLLFLVLIIVVTLTAAQMESRAQRWAAGGTGDQGEYVQAGDGAGVRRGTWARSLF